MEQEQATTITASLYPSQIEKVTRFQELFKIRKWSQALQRLIDEAIIPDSQPNQSPASQKAK